MFYLLTYLLTPRTGEWIYGHGCVIRYGERKYALLLVYCNDDDDDRLRDNADSFPIIKTTESSAVAAILHFA